MPAPIVWNRTPLSQSLLAPLPPTAIRPDGWLRQRIGQEAPLDAHGMLLRACVLGEETLLEEALASCARMAAEKHPDPPDIRALLVYHAVSADRQVPLCLLQYAKSLRDRLMDGWHMPTRDANDVGDLLRMALWLYNLTGQKGLLALCRMLKAQAPDWMSTFHTFAQTRAVQKAPDTATDAYWRVHGATIAASLKTPALQALFEGGYKNETAFAVGWSKLMRYHGAAHGLYNANPLLAGANPSSVARTETAQELMHSLATLLWAQADPLVGDILEQIAFGYALAGTDHQSANQLTARAKDPTNGLTQYAANLWMATSDMGLAAVGYAPCEVRWRIGGQPVRVTVQTRYPYEESVRIHVWSKAPVRFPLRLRIPAWADAPEVRIQGEMQPNNISKGFLTVERTWKEDTMEVRLPMQARTVKRYHQSVSIEYGPLTFALPISPDSSWQMALNPEQRFEMGEEKGIPVLYAAAAPVPAWQPRGDVPAPPPIAPRVEEGAWRRIALAPYGETNARIAQFPVAHQMDTKEVST